MAVDGHLNFDTRLNSRNFKHGISDIVNSLSGVKKMLLGIASAAGLAFGVKEMIESAAEVKAATSQMTQTFGEFQGEAEYAIERVAKESGILETRLNSTATGIYAFAKTAGMDSVQALDMMQDALQVAADSAAYYDRSLEDTSETLKSFLKGNYANDAALGISATEYTRNAAAMKLYGKSFQELSEAQKQLTLLQMVKDANRLSGAEGQAAREADGWENVIGNLKETWRQLMAVLGQPMLQVATSAVKRLTAALGVLLEKAKAVTATLSELFGWEISDSAAVSENISDSVDAQEALTDAVEETTKAQQKSLAGFDKINTIASNTADNASASSGTSAASAVTSKISVKDDTAQTSKRLTAFVKKAKKIFSDLIGYLNKNFAPSFKKVWTQLSPQLTKFGENIKKVFSDIKSLVPPLVSYFNGYFVPFLQRFIETSGGILAGLFDSFNTVFSDIWDIAVFPILKNFVEIGLPLITAFATEIMQTIGTLFNVIKSVFDTLWEDVAVPVLSLFAKIWKETMGLLKEFWDKYGAVIFEKLRKAISNVGSIFKTVWDTILKPIFQTLAKVLDELWTNHLKPLIQRFLEFAGVLATAALDIFNNFITPVTTWFAKTFGPIISGIISGILEAVGSAIGGILDYIGDLFDILIDLIHFISYVFKGDWKKAWEAMRDVFSDIWNAIADIAKIPIKLIIGFVNVFLEAIETALNFLIDGINMFSINIPDWVPKIGGKKFGFDFDHINIPEIPQLAQGTVVPANYGNFLAMLGDNKRETEVVSPLSTMKKALSEALAENGGTTPKEITVYTYLFPNSAAFHREVVKIVNTDKARKG